MTWVQEAGAGSAFATLAPDDVPVEANGTDPARTLLAEGLNAHREGKLERALSAYRQIMGFDPEAVHAMTAAAILHHDQGEHEAAEWLLRRSIQIAPTCIAYNTLGTTAFGRRQYDAALNAYRASITLDPLNYTTWPNLLFSLDLHPYATSHLRLAERRRFNELHCRALTEAAPPHTNDPDPERRLRVGYVSADYSQHSAAHGFGPVISGHHADQVEMYLYDVAQAAPDPADQVHVWFRGLADVWRDARGLSDESLAAQIRADRIDILVDLSGYSAGGRVLAFARKPAPVQIGGFGYATGTGIDAMDYLIADDVVIPPQHERDYHETPLRLPIFMGYEAAPPWPDVGPAPRAANGYTTFGYLGRAVKLSPQTLAAWAEILLRVPTSRMLFKSGELRDQSLVEQIRDTFRALGVDPDRLEFRGGTSRPDHLAAAGDVDVMLDPFPHNSGVTAVESALMGVPLITLLGDSLCGRVGASVMTQLGFGGAVARTPYEYVSNAIAVASDTWTQADRQGLRLRLLDSVLLNPDAYATAVERAYRDVWRRWVATRAGS